MSVCVHERKSNCNKRYSSVVPINSYHGTETPCWALITPWLKLLHLIIPFCWQFYQKQVFFFTVVQHVFYQALLPNAIDECVSLPHVDNIIRHTHTQRGLIKVKQPPSPSSMTFHLREIWLKKIIFGNCKAFLGCGAKSAVFNCLMSLSLVLKFILFDLIIKYEVYTEE